MSVTALSCLTLWSSLYCLPPSASYFPTVTTKSRPSDDGVRGFFCSESLVDTGPLAHCLCVKQAHHSASIFVYRLFRALLQTCIAMSSSRARNESDDLLKEHLAVQQQQEDAFLMTRGGSSDGGEPPCIVQSHVSIA